MSNYIIYGTSLSGMIAYDILKNENVVCFVDKTGKVNNDKIPNNSLVYSYVSEIENSLLSKTERILIAVGNRILAETIREELNKVIEGIEILTVYDDEFIDKYLKLKYEIEDKKIKEEYKSIKEIPKVFGIEIVLGCNLKCVGCQEGSGLITRKKGLMSYENFKIIIDKIKDFANVVMLHGYGEPMLHPEILKMIKYAADNCKENTNINISTNGININEKMADDLINSGVKSIIVSIDAVSEKVYQLYRKGGDFDQVINALRLLVKYNQINGNRVDIEPQFIVFRHNQHEMKQFSDMCNDLGLKPAFKAPFLLTGSGVEESSKKEFIRRKYSSERDLYDAMKYCLSAKNDFFIRLDGSVYPCCFDYNGTFNYGNIYSEDVLSIWNKKVYKNFRGDIISGKIPEFCRENCMLYFLK